jgi:hypothetical protein
VEMDIPNFHNELSLIMGILCNDLLADFLQSRGLRATKSS